MKVKHYRKLPVRSPSKVLNDPKDLRTAVYHGLPEGEWVGPETVLCLYQRYQWMRKECSIHTRNDVTRVADTLVEEGWLEAKNI